MKMWMTAAALGGAVLGGFVGIGAQAQPIGKAAPAPADTPAGPFRAADGDRDGTVTRDEAAAEADRRFAAMDTDHDGKLSAEERRAYRVRNHPVRNARAREMTQAQFRERALRMFDRADTNHDGRIDAREREAMALMMRARRAGHDRRDTIPSMNQMPAPANAQ